MTPRVPEEKPSKAKGQKTLSMYDKGHTTIHTVNGCSNRIKQKVSFRG